MEHQSRQRIADSWAVLFQPLAAGEAFDVQSYLFAPRYQARLAGTLIQHQRTALAFVAGRLDAELKLAQDIAAASSSPEMVSAWTDFLKTATQQYGAAARNLLQLESLELIEASGAGTAGELRDIAASSQIMA
ncbi:MAG: hypothetical protein QHC67_18210 [Sphingobium sp.]|uniref:hypothetical protein n=1 Tax=Sphingobium sp. TaxID=1912891 RepID=UPI0029B6E5F8|nr:hypothetical protein [Sphingobium sp.]MDX3911711.1 hypothetical protein [Sphingobium sp.]